ncbi:uncharacterized protein LOC143238663 [Tachypleus tridentatus]|uniref:uncharacterized protein LOC143238663 n=1 Tax=Tachypleus tridentatus TaxID=6853 RepID=UPI003FD0784E
MSSHRWSSFSRGRQVAKASMSIMEEESLVEEEEDTGNPEESKADDVYQRTFKTSRRKCRRIDRKKGWRSCKKHCLTQGRGPKWKMILKLVNLLKVIRILLRRKVLKSSLKNLKLNLSV